ncbi:MAG TPA: hypothetical protein VHX62_18700 [Solirubrobacteraceae bacterium]|nr:hypothetical protein [Solirubrobacteraceae bacterium]
MGAPVGVVAPVVVCWAAAIALAEPPAAMADWPPVGAETEIVSVPGPASAASTAIEPDFGVAAEPSESAATVGAAKVTAAGVLAVTTARLATAPSCVSGVTCCEENVDVTPVSSAALWRSCSADALISALEGACASESEELADEELPATVDTVCGASAGGELA